MDHVDMIIAQWRRERPDLDTGPMALLARFNRLHARFRGEIEANLARFGLTPANFDILATMRRAGPPYRLSPGDLLGATRLTSGTMTARIDQLEKLGLVQRAKNPQDGRSLLVTLTPKGLELIDRAVSAHVATQHRITAFLSASERETLDGLLRDYLPRVEKAACDAMVSGEGIEPSTT